MTDQPSKLREFTVAIEWTAPQRPHTETVIARSADDAKEIAVRLFRASRVPAVKVESVMVDSVKEIDSDQS